MRHRSCEIVEFSFGTLPAVLAGGNRRTALRALAPLYNVQPHPKEPALTAFWVPLVQAPVFISLAGPDRERLRARRRKLADLPPAADSTALDVTSGAFRPIRSTTSATFITAADRASAPASEFPTCAANVKRERRRTSRRSHTSRTRPTCGVPLTAQRDIRILHRRHRQRERPGRRPPAANS